MVALLRGSASRYRGLVKAHPGTTPTALLIAALLTVAGCAGDGPDKVAVGSAPVSTVPPTTGPPTAGAQATAATTTTTPVQTTARPRPTTTAASARRPRVLSDRAWTPFAIAGGVTLTHPSARVERVGFHESNHDGARQLEPLPTAVSPTTLKPRNRQTGSRTAADVVVDPGGEIRAPVTGRVKRAGTYVLYCRQSDDYVVIEPAQHPGWEVKVLHIDGVRVKPGQRVTAGQSVLAPRATRLPFRSQVDEHSTTVPPWPHVHIEVIDPSIPDRPTPGGGCD